MSGKLKPKNLAKKLDAPQKYLMDKLASAVGEKPGRDSEGTAFNIVDRVAKRAGLGNSTAANAAKALGVAGLSLAADPLNLVPGGKLVKLGAKAASRGAKAASRGSKAASRGSKAASQGAKSFKTLQKARADAAMDIFKQRPKNVAKELDALKTAREIKAAEAAGTPLTKKQKAVKAVLDRVKEQKKEKK